jgi:hypothetical protein
MTKKIDASQRALWTSLNEARRDVECTTLRRGRFGALKSADEAFRNIQRVVDDFKTATWSDDSDNFWLKGALIEEASILKRAAERKAVAADIDQVRVTAEREILSKMENRSPDLEEYPVGHFPDPYRSVFQTAEYFEREAIRMQREKLSKVEGLPEADAKSAVELERLGMLVSELADQV